MNKVIKSTLVLSILTTMSMAEGMYWGGGIVTEDYDADDNGVGAELLIGKVFYNNFGIEGKINKTLSTSKETKNGIKAEAESMNFSIFGTYSHALNSEFTIMPKIGLTNFSTDAKFSNNFGGKVKLDDSSTEISYGIDLKYRINMNTNVYASYTIFNPKLDDNNGVVGFDEDTDPKYFSIGIQQKF